MALASFIRKASLSAIDLLHSLSVEEFENILADTSVEVVFDVSCTNSTEGRVALDLLIDLLSRLYPRLVLTARDVPKDCVDSLTHAALLINPALEFGRQKEPNATVALGRHDDPQADKTVYIGSDAWIAKCSTWNALTFGNSKVPFGPAAAARIAAANVFRIVFASFLPRAMLDQDLALDLRTCGTNEEGSLLPEIADPTDIGTVRLVGVGAIGNAVVWALSRTEATGCIHLIDPEAVDDSNPQRYVLTTSDCINVPKVQIAKKAFQGPGLAALEFQTDWAGYLAQRDDWYIPLVAVAVDSSTARCEIQASLPRYILNAWTHPRDLGVSRHEFLGDQACLCCLYLPRGEKADLEYLVAVAINFRGDIIELRSMLFYVRPLTKDSLDPIPTRLDCDPVELHALLNRSLL